MNRFTKKRLAELRASACLLATDRPSLARRVEEDAWMNRIRLLVNVAYALFCAGGVTAKVTTGEMYAILGGITMARVLAEAVMQDYEIMLARAEATRERIIAEYNERISS